MGLVAVDFLTCIIDCIRSGGAEMLFFEVTDLPPKMLIIFFVVVYMLVKTSENIFRG